MITLNGKSVFEGVGIGKIHFFKNSEKSVELKIVADSSLEVRRYERACLQMVQQLQGLYQKALETIGEEEAAIFEVHRMMLEGDDYRDTVLDYIRNRNWCAEYAVKTATEDIAALFGAMEDSYMRARAADIKDIGAGLLRFLLGDEGQRILLTEPVIVAAKDLAPSETILLDKSKVLGFVTAQGSANSHTAILARTMGIPALVGVGEELNGDLNGMQAAIDGYKGVLYIEPDEYTLNTMQSLQQEETVWKAQLLTLKGAEDITLDGRAIKLYANIGSVADLESVLYNDARGIGLLRSEFLYLDRSDYPSEDDQFKQYRQVLERMEGKQVIIRTLDIGADKQVDYFALEKEENPALGYRAIRICLTREEIFRTQLRALYRASAYGNLAVMFPMITSLWEIKRIKEIVTQVKEELRAEGYLMDDGVKLGVMIETPAAVMISDELAKEVDFFSVGTNDLTQYTLALDRQNHSLEPFFDPHHPAVLKMLEMIVANAHKNGIWAGICGELAADPTLTERFLQMGYDELSVSPVFILPMRKRIREMTTRALGEGEQ